MSQSRGMEEDAALRAYYEQGMERERLGDGRGDLGFTRTTEIVLRRLPGAPAVVAEAAGVAGIRTAVGDVRDLDLPDASVNAVLLLGPLYHPGPARPRMGTSTALAAGRLLRRSAWRWRGR